MSAPYVIQQPNESSDMTDIVPHGPPSAIGQREISPLQADGTLTLASAVPGRSYHVAALGKSWHRRLELLSTGLAPDIVLELLQGEGNRPRVVACGDIRAAIGADLAADVCLKPCGADCGCRCLGEKD